MSVVSRLPFVQNFWPRLASKYGVKKYWQNSGEETAIVNAVSAATLPMLCFHVTDLYDRFGRLNMQA